MALRERSKSPNPKRFSPTFSSDTDGASTGPPWLSFASSARRLWPFAAGKSFRFTSGGALLGSSLESPPQPAISAQTSSIDAMRTARARTECEA